MLCIGPLFRAGVLPECLVGGRRERLKPDVLNPGAPPALEALLAHLRALAWERTASARDERATNTPGLFERVVAHRRVYFKVSGVNYTSMARGSLRIVPDETRMAAWAKDYTAMQQEMFYGDPPPWQEVVEVVAEGERAFNRPGTSQS